MRLVWPALTPALAEIRLFDWPVSSVGLVASSQRPAPNGISGLAASWLFNARRQAHFLLTRYIVSVRAKASYRCGPLSSNVRHQTNRLVPLQQEVRLSA